MFQGRQIFNCFRILLGTKKQLITAFKMELALTRVTIVDKNWLEDFILN